MIKSVVYRGAELGCEVIGIRRGWEGLTHVDLNEPASKAHYILPLNRENTRTIDRTGGTFLHSSRTNPTKMRNLPPALQDQKFEAKESTIKGVTTTTFNVTAAVLENIDMLGLDQLIAIGAGGSQVRLDDRDQGRRYAMAPIPDPKLGPRKVEIASMYDTEHYRPQYDHKIDLPIFLTRSK